VPPIVAALKAKRASQPKVPPAPIGGEPEPQTQKARGIRTLQGAGLLGKGFARIATTEEEAVTGLQAMRHGGVERVFARPCPITARHGFEDSIEVHSAGEVRALWGRARALDPQAELILMPFVPAAHNCVWQPGMLSVGPGYDGATRGENSVSIFLTPGVHGRKSEHEEKYPNAHTWNDLARQAGVRVDGPDPVDPIGKPRQVMFLESVSGPGHGTVVTQIRGAHDTGVPRSPDWIPRDLTVRRVISIDPTTKALPDKMVAWESEAKALDPTGDVVWNPGGNLGDHYSVHARINGIAVCTTFKPCEGQSLQKTADEIPIEPQLVIWGFLGGILGPLLADNYEARKQAVCAAVLGTHHGCEMTAESGVFLGASVAFMLRLGQAALWGEARHARSYATGVKPEYLKTLGGVTHGSHDRQQIFREILDEWLKGRQGLDHIVGIFHAKWRGGFGGDAWASCGHALVQLDKAMLDLIRVPSRMHAKRVLGSLTTVVNLAHNARWWLDKFLPETVWFDLAAAQDPRVALYAGPVWYESAIVPADVRVTLLDEVKRLKPVDLSPFPKPHANVVEGKPTHVHGIPHVKMGVGDGIGSGGYHAPYNAPTMTSKKVGTFGTIAAGGQIPIEKAPIMVLAKGDGGQLHVQIVTDTEGHYLSGAVTGAVPAIDALPTMPSASGSGVTYHVLPLVNGIVSVGGQIVLTVVVTS